MKRMCFYPFENIEINQKGEVYTCCPTWINEYSIGNVFEQNLDEIWNGEKARKLRKSVIDGDYSFCSKEYCVYVSGNFKNSENSEKYSIENTPFPRFVKLSYDKECNIACRICRDNLLKNTLEEEKELNKYFDEKIFPFLKDAKVVTVNTCGDPFGSRHSRRVIQKIGESYPDIKFDFHTNGTLCSLKMLSDLNVSDKIQVMRISVSATTEQTYDKIVQFGNGLFKRLLTNLEDISKLKKKYGFEFYLHFIVTAKNYKEIEDFIDFAEKYGATPCFWEYNSTCSFAKNIDESWIITNPEHEEYSEFVKILSSPKFEKYKLYMSPVLLKIRGF